MLLPILLLLLLLLQLLRFQKLTCLFLFHHFPHGVLSLPILLLHLTFDL